MLPPPPQDSPVKSSSKKRISGQVLDSLPAPPRDPRQKRLRIATRGANASRTLLFHFDSRTGIGKFLLDALGFVLGDALFYSFGGAIHQVLGFFQAQAGYFADRLDY